MQQVLRSLGWSVVVSRGVVETSTLLPATQAAVECDDGSAAA